MHWKESAVEAQAEGALNGVLPHSLLKLGCAESVLAEIITTTTTKKRRKKKDKKKENTVTFGNFNWLKEDNLILDHNWEIFFFFYLHVAGHKPTNRPIRCLKNIVDLLVVVEKKKKRIIFALTGESG